jgi:hypothetical protein
MYYAITINLLLMIKKEETYILDCAKIWLTEIYICRKKDVKKSKLCFFYILYKNNLDDYLFGKLLGVFSTEY